MKRCIFLLMGFLWGIVSAFSSSLHFRPLKPILPLPTNEVRNLFQDSDGYIWIATYSGLLRYDGYSTIMYRPDAKNKDHSIDGFVNIVREGKQGNLWIGTHNGLYMLDKRKDEVKKISLSGLSSADSYIEAITCGADGDIWVGTGRGLYRKKTGENDFCRCDNIAEVLNIKSLMEDYTGDIWIGTWNQGLWRYDRKNNVFLSYKGINPGNSAHILFQDKSGEIWIGTWRYGLLNLKNPYDMQHYSFVRYMHNAKEKNSIADDIIYSIAQDSNTGKLWIGSRSGLSIMESAQGEGTFTNYLPGNNTDDLPFNEVNALLCSHDGLMWVGLLGGGVCTVNTRKSRSELDTLSELRKFFPTSSVRSIFQDDSGWLWLGIMGFGLVKYNYITKEVIPYHHFKEFASLPHISTVNEIIDRKKTGEYCFATWDDGVWLYDGNRVKVINDKSYPLLKDVCIYSVLEDREGNLWLGSRSGLFMLDSFGKLHSLEQLTGEGNKDFSCSSVFKLVEDGNGDIWVATAVAGVWRIQRKKNKYSVRCYDVSNHNASIIGAVSLAVDNHNRIWAGGNETGVCMYDRDKDIFVPMLNDYFEESEIVSCILNDGHGSIWITTNLEVYRIKMSESSDKMSVEIFTIEDGLQGYIFNRNACCMGKNGKIFLGGVHGINILDIDVMTSNTYSSPVVITDLKIYNESVRNMERSKYDEILSGSLDCTDYITLHYNQNNFSLSFSVLDYINSDLNKYEYQLEGYDEHWVSATAYHRFAFYNNLSPGEYVFRVRGANSNGVWSENTRELIITILPPPWLSWWAYCLYIILLLLCCYIAYRIIRKRMHLKHMIELGNVERQKLEELNHTKLQFFTNITHELLTPLSIMSALLDELRSQHPELKDVLEDFSVSMTRLTRLIQQILEFRKIENNRQKLKVSEGNITKFLRQSVAAFSPLVRKKHLYIVFNDKDIEVEGYFDIDKLDKIAYNLLSNAAKYTSEGGIITVEQFYDVENKLWGFSVNNPGDIIPEEKLSHLFERFYEGEYRRFHTNGTGIGLSLTKDLVMLHHGKIEVSSTVEQGNTFSITIPINKEAFAENEIDEAIVAKEDILELQTDGNSDLYINDLPVERSEDGDKKKPVLLLVEDNDELSNVMARRLSDYFNVIKSGCAELALDELKLHKVDIVVTDVMMEGMNGFELCQKIKNTFETSHIPVIILTACTADIDRVKGYEVGADGYLYKPFNMNVLLAKIDNLLKKSDIAVGDSRKKLVFEAKEVDYTSQDEIFLRKAVECVNSHLSDLDFDAAQFAVEMGMSRSTCNDKLKELTGMTPLAFISSIRLQAAFRMIQEKKKIRVSDLAYAVGFNDPKYFSQCFRKKFGFLPKEYMLKNE